MIRQNINMYRYEKKGNINNTTFWCETSSPTSKHEEVPCCLSVTTCTCSVISVAWQITPTVSSALLLVLISWSYWLFLHCVYIILTICTCSVISFAWQTTRLYRQLYYISVENIDYFYTVRTVLSLNVM